MSGSGDLGRGLEMILGTPVLVGLGSRCDLPPLPLSSPSVLVIVFFFRLRQPCEKPAAISSYASSTLSKTTTLAAVSPSQLFR